MANNSPGRIYLLVADAKKLLDTRVNLVAKIAEVGIPKRSKGTDYCLILKIVDSSCFAQAVSVNFFAARKENLPSVKSAGDVIFLHLAEVKIFNGDVYFLFNKKLSTFALFHGNSDMGLSPYQTSANYHATDRSRELLVQLRTLSFEKSDDAGATTSLPPVKDTESGKVRLSLLKDIESGKVSDVICKVLHVCEASEDEWTLFIWDGTDAPPIVFQANLDLENREASALHEPLPLSRETLRSFPCVGTVLRVTIGKSYEDIHRLQDGDLWVKLYSVTCEIQSEIWTGKMSSSSRIFILSDEDGHVKYRRRLYNERIANKARLPLQGVLEFSHVTGTDYEKAAYTTLRDSLTNPQVTHRVKCVVRVVASYPWKGDDLCSSFDGHHRLRLILEDPTARIRAYLPNEEGEKFFGGNLGPEDLTRKMARLLGIRESSGEENEPVSRNPPWIKCCLMSYFLDENDPWGTRMYRIHGTRLLD